MLAATVDLRDIASIMAIFAAIFFVVGYGATATLMRAPILVSLVCHIRTLPSFLKKRGRGKTAHTGFVSRGDVFRKPHARP
jgi:hypothetical protein